MLNFFLYCSIATGLQTIQFLFNLRLASGNPRTPSASFAEHARDRRGVQFWESKSRAEPNSKHRTVACWQAGAEMYLFLFANYFMT
jgi:hypothetical protein